VGHGASFDLNNKGFRRLVQFAVEDVSAAEIHMDPFERFSATTSATTTGAISTPKSRPHKPPKRACFGNSAHKICATRTHVKARTSVADKVQSEPRSLETAGEQVANLF
jgi:hypothetical protein